MYLTLGQAAKATGKSKATISKYIKNGTLSTISKENSGYEIDPAELFRVFPKQTPVTTSIEQSQTVKNTPVNSSLEREIELLRERLNDKNDVIEDLRERLDLESEERRKLTMLITDQRENPPEKPVERRKKILGMF